MSVEIVLEFENDEYANEWIGWYLDGTGEAQMNTARETAGKRMFTLSFSDPGDAPVRRVEHVAESATLWDRGVKISRVADKCADVVVDKCGEPMIHGEAFREWVRCLNAAPPQVTAMLELLFNERDSGGK
jgi:hypothetical protein